MNHPVQAGFSSDSTIWVSDSGLQRLSWFDRNGKFIQSKPARPTAIPGGPWRSQPRTVLRNGTVLGASYLLSEHSGEVFPVVLWKPDDTYDVLAWLPRGPDTGMPVTNSQGLPLQVPRPIRGDPLILFPSTGQGFSILERSPAAGPRGGIIIHRFLADGTPDGKVIIPYEAVAMPDSVRTWARAHGTRYLENLRRASPNVRGIASSEMEDAIWVPGYLPPVTAAFEDPDGYWLVREGPRPRIIERYSSAGSPIGVVSMPEGVPRLLAASSAGFLGFSTDSLHVPVVRFYAVTWEAAS
jgi:hypothetical protein